MLFCTEYIPEALSVVEGGGSHRILYQLLGMAVSEHVTHPLLDEPCNQM